MVRRILWCVGLLMVAFSVAGCSLAIDYAEQKARMEEQATVNVATETVWKAAIKAAEDLKINISKKEFDGTEGMLAGNCGKLDYIRIYVTQHTPTITKIGVQARTAAWPAYSSGYDHDFAEIILNKIKANL